MADAVYMKFMHYSELLEMAFGWNGLGWNGLG